MINKVAEQFLTMDDIEETMSDIYNTLVQIRYPKITTATVKNLELTVLKGQNRISLLSWLLCEKSSSIAASLEKLKGPTLEGFNCIAIE